MPIKGGFWLPQCQNQNRAIFFITFTMLVKPEQVAIVLSAKRLVSEGLAQNRVRIAG